MDKEMTKRSNRRKRTHCERQAIKREKYRRRSHAEIRARGKIKNNRTRKKKRVSLKAQIRFRSQLSLEKVADYRRAEGIGGLIHLQLRKTCTEKKGEHADCKKKNGKTNRQSETSTSPSSRWLASKRKKFEDRPQSKKNGRARIEFKGMEDARECRPKTETKPARRTRSTIVLSIQVMQAGGDEVLENGNLGLSGVGGGEKKGATRKASSLKSPRRGEVRKKAVSTIEQDHPKRKTKGRTG